MASDDTAVTRTACSYCGVGCGIEVTTRDEPGRGRVIATVRGDKLHPTNAGKLCTKGATHADMMNAVDGRLHSAHLRPARGGPAQAVDLDTAITTAAQRLREIVDEHGPDAVAMYVSGQMSLEAQYLATKLAKGYLRTKHLESNSRLCMASAGTGYKQSLGADGPPGSYQDFDHADVFLVIGSNMADCHPILFLRMAERLNAGAKLIVVDPRRTATAERADLYLPIRPGTDLALLNGILALLMQTGDLDDAFINAYTEGWEQMPPFLADYPPERVAEITGLHVADIRAAARMIAEADNWMSCWTMGLNQSTHGTWNTNAICNLHLATGSICRIGSGPMSLTGQPNAMGGREMGYMGPGLPGQRSVTSEADREFCEDRWGLDAGTIRSDVGTGTIDMFSAMAAGEVKACWIICTNPVASVANRKTVIDGLEAADLVITQDAYAQTATNDYADILLPAALWSESEMVMVNSERTLTLLPQSTTAPGAAVADWELIARMAAAMGYAEAFDYSSSAEVFDEITTFWNPQTGYDLRGADYQRLHETPLQWPCPPATSDDGAPDGRHPVRYLNDGVSQTLFVDDDGSTPALAFATSSRKARFWPRPHMDPAEMPDDEYPLVLNTGRLQHQWHTMTKTGKVAKLNKLNPTPFVEINPEDAEKYAVVEGAEVEIASRRGRAVYPAVITDRVRAGTCFAPFHWNDEHGEYLTVNAVTNDAVDADSRQPEFKACAVSVRPVAASRPVAPAVAIATEPHPLADLLGVPQSPPPLDDSEKYYLGGYLAGLQARSGTVAVAPTLPEAAPVRSVVRMWVDGMLAAQSVSPPPATTETGSGPATSRTSLMVLWASQTGGAQEVATAVQRGLTEAGRAAQLVEMDACEIEQLSTATDVVVVTSTFGDGGPPDNASGFWERLRSSSVRLDGTRFAVLGIGDSSYADFCGYAAKVDERLADLGAHRLTELVRCESDDDDLTGSWLADITGILGADTDTPGAVVAEPQQQAPSQPSTRAHPVRALLIRNTLLSGPRSQKEVRHIGFDLRDHDFDYEVGDSLAVLPVNDAAQVETFLAAARLDGDVMVDAGDGALSLADALRTRRDIGRVSPALLRFVAERSGSEHLATLLRKDNRNELDKWLWGRHVIDVVRDHPIDADAAEWMAALGALRSRHYSISSSPRDSPHEVQLTISVVRYDGDDGLPRGGVCSTFLADRVGEVAVPIHLNRSPHFRPPADPRTPMIMVGAGTGIAPFRGFLHDRRVQGHPGDNWLFFGDQRATENFYYRDELEDMFRDGFLTRLDLAFSRDQRERIYVQHRMIEHGARLWRWLQRGAHFYVCGDAARMAKDVDEALLGIVAHHGKLDIEAAEAFRRQLVAEHRYVRDVY